MTPQDEWQYGQPKNALATSRSWRHYCKHCPRLQQRSRSVTILDPTRLQCIVIPLRTLDPTISLTTGTGIRLCVQKCGATRGVHVVVRGSRPSTEHMLARAGCHLGTHQCSGCGVRERGSGNPTTTHRYNHAYTQTACTRIQDIIVSGSAKNMCLIHALSSAQVRVYCGVRVIEYECQIASMKT